MSGARPEHVAATTWHGRRGTIRHGFRYGVDYVLIDPESTAGTALFSRNRFNLYAVHDRDHGGARDAGRGAAWAREVLAGAGLEDAAQAGGPIALRLLTQPRCLGYRFNPVSFWLALREGRLVAVIAEVDNTFGDRHSYLCHTEGFAPIGAATRLGATKIMHVSPFQDVAGTYEFRFDITPGAIDIVIVFRNGDEGVTARLHGPRAPMRDLALARAALRRPFGALRTTALIHWQALRLKLKGAAWRARPAPPKKEISRCS